VWGGGQKRNGSREGNEGRGRGGAIFERSVRGEKECE